MGCLRVFWRAFQGLWGFSVYTSRHQRNPRYYFRGTALNPLTRGKLTSPSTGLGFRVQGSGFRAYQ